MMKIERQILQQWAALEIDSIDFKALENSLERELAEHFADLSALESEREIIGSV
jgi:hypothetical protein